MEKYEIWGLHAPCPPPKKIAFGEPKMLNFRPFLSLNLCVYEFWSFARPLAWEKFAFGELQNAWFHVFFKSKLISIYDFWGCIENWQSNYFSMFPTDAGDFTCLAGFYSIMWEILHDCRESGRNSVQAGDSLSMRESWKPCYCHM